MDSNIIITETPTLSTKSISDSISEQINVSTSSDESSWKFLNILRYLLILFILLFLAFNLFSYLGKKRNGGSNILGNIGNMFGKTLKKTADNTAKGTKGAVKIGASAIGNTVNTLEHATKKVVRKTSNSISSGVNQLHKKMNKQYGKNKRNKIDGQNSGAGKALSNNNNQNSYPSTPMPDNAGSKTQNNPVTGKTGYCYIGEDKGFRSCLQVNEADICMSGDIFPTRDICINPRLRQ
tara:strand:- start:81 stop:791 length:711 start_codon:yes stop_codon:yes gene_type:complete